MASPGGQASNRIFIWASIALFLAALLVIALTYEDYGMSFDEPFHHKYGEIIARYYASRFQETKALRYENLSQYGGAFDLPLYLALSLPTKKKIDPIDAGHLFTALVGLVGVAGTWKLGRLLRGRRAAFLAAALLLIYPSYAGHMFNNPKDLPFAVGYVWSLYFLLSMLDSLPGLTIKRIAILGLTIGLTMGVRVGGVLLLGYAWLAGVWFAISPAWFSPPQPASASAWQRLMRVSLPLFGVSLIAYLVMLAAWPSAQLSPIAHPLEVLTGSVQFSWNNPVLLNGVYYSPTHLPISYIPQYFLVKTPELILLCSGLGLALGLGALVSRRYRQARLQAARYILLAVAMLAPIAIAMLTRATLYDEVRHFLFVVPLLCAVAGLALDKLFDVSNAWAPPARWALYAGLAALLAWQAYNLALLYPYQYIYYNALAGGVKGAQGRYELDYWGVSFGEAIRNLAAQLGQPGAGAAPHEHTALVCGAEQVAETYLPRNFRLVKNPQEADYYISTTRYNCQENHPGKVVVSIERAGVLLTVIKDLRQPGQP